MAAAMLNDKAAVLAALARSYQRFEVDGLGEIIVRPLTAAALLKIQRINREPDIPDEERLFRAGVLALADRWVGEDGRPIFSDPSEIEGLGFDLLQKIVAAIGPALDNGAEIEKNSEPAPSAEQPTT